MYFRPKTVQSESLVAAETERTITNVLESTTPIPTTKEWTWVELTGTNYGTYIANLRNVKCPESAITSIVIGDVNRTMRPYLQSVREGFLRTNSFNYWTATSKGKGKSLTTRWSDIEAQVNRDRLATIRQYVTTELPTEALASITSPLTSEISAEGGLDFLPQTQRDSIVKQFGDLHDRMIADSKKGLDSAVRLSNLIKGQQEIYNALSSELSPDQLLDLKVRTSFFAGNLREGLGYMEPTEEEFKKIYSSFEQARKDSSDPVIAETLASKEIGEFLDADRMSSFRRSRSTAFTAIANFCDGNAIGLDNANKLYDLYLETASTFGDHPDVTSPAFQSIQQKAAQLLQKDYAGFLESHGGVWLTGAGIPPDSSISRYPIQMFPVLKNPYRP